MPSALLATLWLLGAAAVVPPLTDAQIGRLETARDGHDHREEAFVALVENALAFEGTGPQVAGFAAVRLAPDLDALLADPAAHRGELCRIAGVLQQATPLTRPHAGATEWFVRDPRGRPVLVYVAGLTPEDQATYRAGLDIAVYARFYKRIDAEARDGTMHSYAAFVGARPWRMDGARAESSALPGLFAVMVLLLVGLGAVFLVLIVLTRRQRGGGRARAVVTGGAAPEELDDGGPLPDDPVEALTELRRRAADEA